MFGRKVCVPVVVILAFSCLGSLLGAASSAGAAKKPAVTFRCGTKTCDARTSYCELIKSDAPEIPSSYSCKPLPPACRADAPGAKLNCNCFPRGTRCDFCDVLQENGVYHLNRMCVGGS